MAEEQEAMKTKRIVSVPVAPMLREDPSSRSMLVCPPRIPVVMGSTDGNLGGIQAFRIPHEVNFPVECLYTNPFWAGVPRVYPTDCLTELPVMTACRQLRTPKSKASKSRVRIDQRDILFTVGTHRRSCLFPGPSRQSVGHPFLNEIGNTPA
jgi:hypothetical protein